MDPSIVETVRKKFQTIRQLQKEQVGHKRKNILPMIGVGKEKKERKRKFDDKFNISNIIQKARKKITNKYSKFSKLYHGETTLKSQRKLVKRQDYGMIKINTRGKSSEIKLSHKKSITSGLNDKIVDPYWKNDILTSLNASIRKDHLIKDTSSTSPTKNITRRNKNLDSTILTPFTLNFDSPYNFKELPQTVKHDCLHRRSSSVKPIKKDGCNMDKDLPRDYKVFDVNMTISPLYSKMENKTNIDANPAPIDSTPEAVKHYDRFAYQNVYLKNNRIPSRLLGDKDIKKSEQVTKVRNDFSPIMRQEKAGPGYSNKDHLNKTIDSNKKIPFILGHEIPKINYKKQKNKEFKFLLEKAITEDSQKQGIKASL
ncbi:unnamed protein product [Moneuplotes crassus]|uniref:Uncharacterized protein n=1 Tax=Euplotes crassus TaxID=5936 RepID=A0AAD1URE3_EUPCR|nr:unnamed protein product [Moneuplotes crassus]